MTHAELRARWPGFSLTWASQFEARMTGLRNRALRPIYEARMAELAARARRPAELAHQAALREGAGRMAELDALLRANRDTILASGSRRRRLMPETLRRDAHARLDALIASAGPPPGTWEVMGPPRAPARPSTPKRSGWRIDPSEFPFWHAVYMEHHL